ncbi:MAG: phosphoribosyltransferase family protein [Actinomycetota bacterium]
MRRRRQRPDTAVRFADRRNAGRRLAAQVRAAINGRSPIDRDALVFGLPRGGVPVAAEVARSLDAPLSIVAVRKLGAPSRPELAIGAIGEHGVRIVDDDLIRRLGVTDAQLDEIEHREQAAIASQVLRFRDGRPLTSLDGHVVIVVDDGIATGATARAACEVVRHAGADRVLLATPVAPLDWVDRLADAADEYLAVETPDPFGAVGAFYEDFGQTDDAEVVRLLRHAAERRAP